VPISDPQWNWVNKLDDVPSHLLREIEHFFQIYKELEEKKTGVEGWEDCEQAVKAIEESRRRYTEEGG